MGADLTRGLGPLVDHHCHGVLLDDVDRALFESLMNEATSAAPLGTTLFDSMVGLAVRRWCAPVLDLPALSSPGRLSGSASRAGIPRVLSPADPERGNLHLPGRHRAQLARGLWPGGNRLAEWRNLQGGRPSRTRSRGGTRPRSRAPPHPGGGRTVASRVDHDRGEERRGLSRGPPAADVDADRRCRGGSPERGPPWHGRPLPDQASRRSTRGLRGRRWSWVCPSRSTWATATAIWI